MMPDRVLSAVRYDGTNGSEVKTLAETPNKTFPMFYGASNQVQVWVRRVSNWVDVPIGHWVTLDEFGMLEITRMCPTCDGCGMVCEDHPDLPWSGISVRDDACDCGAGMSCPACCGPIPQDGAQSIGEAFVPTHLRRSGDDDA